MTGSRMDHQAGRLIDDNQIVIFEKNVERYCLRLIVDLFRRRLGQPDFISAPDEIARPRRCAIEPDETAPNQLLQARS